MRIEFRLRCKQLSPTADAVIHSRRLLKCVLSSEGPFGLFLSRDVILLRSELSLPLSFALFYFGHWTRLLLLEPRQTSASSPSPARGMTSSYVALRLRVRVVDPAP